MERMERSERTEKNQRSEQDDAQKAKLIFFSLAAFVAVLLIWSISSGSKARSERDALKNELEMIKSDNIKLEQMVKDLSKDNEILHKKVQQMEAKPKPAAKTKTASKSSTRNKLTRKQR